MSRVRTPGDGPKCMRCGKPAVWSGFCQMEDGHGYCNSVVRTDPVLGLITEAEKALNYLKCCQTITMKPGTRYEWPTNLEHYIREVKESYGQAQPSQGTTRTVPGLPAIPDATHPGC